MASQQNSFALLNDGEDDDLESLLARAAAIRVEVTPLMEKKPKQQKLKNENHQEPPARDDYAIVNERGRGGVGFRGIRGGRGRGGGGGRRFTPDGNGSYLGNMNSGGGVYQREYGRPNGYHRDPDGYRAEPDHEDGYGGNYNADYDQTNWQSRGGGGDWRGRGRGWQGRGTGRGRGRGFYDNQDREEEKEVGGGGGGGWEQVDSIGRDHGLQGDSQVPTQYDRQSNSFSGRRGGAGRGYRARGGSYYEGRDRRNNTRTEAPPEVNETEEKHQIVIPENDDGAGLEKDKAVPADSPNDVASVAVVVPEEVKAENTAADSSEKKRSKEEEGEENNMTLEEYEKVLAEKRKPLESLKNVERKVIIDKEFESMQLIEKKKEAHDHHLKQKAEEKLKKKEGGDMKEDKSRKAVSINEFLKGSMRTGGRGGGGGRGRGRGDNRGYVYSMGADVTPSIHIEDPVQFPVLGGALKA